MFSPTYVDIVTYFYPIGNTSAVHLTRGLPHKQPADILLLGCGDVRNILFTIYTDHQSGRKLDATCCDVQPAIIARNILLLTLILDDDNGKNDASMWDIYYHLYLHDGSLKLLSIQATKLYELGVSMQSWHDSNYGRRLRFCDSGTLSKVRDIWATYRTENLNKIDRERHLQRSKVAIRRAMDTRKHHVRASSRVWTGVYSAAPAGLCAVEDTPKLHKHYWDHGTTDAEGHGRFKAKNTNPMFVTDSSTLHYGIDPLLGFHLAAAYTPLTDRSPLYSKATAEEKSYFKVVKVAKLQFQSWTKALRLNSETVTLRFFTGDAIAFSYALQQKQITGDNTSAGIYRDPYHLEPLIMDGEDYGKSGRAPLSFTVIDTSNLIDHIGAMNLLIATAPLLDNRSSASLYTESIVMREKTHKAYIDTMLYGHFPTVSTLLGLFPVEYWINASSTSVMDDLFLRANCGVKPEDSDRTQMHVQLTWKRTGTAQTLQSPPTTVQFLSNEIGCARVLYDIYLNMFQHENMQRLFSDISMLKLSNHTLLKYHRGSFALFLRFVRSRIRADWNKVMGHLLQLIETDSSLLMGLNYIQELYLYLHLLKVYSLETLSPSFNQNQITSATKGLASWSDMPPVVCITLKVPRKRLEVITNLKPTDIGSPILHCVVQSPTMSTSGRWQNIFSAVQLSFGDISTSGSRHSNAFQVRIVEDKLRWSGNSALFASFMAPTWMLLLEPRTATIAFGIQSTPRSSQVFLELLGVDLNIYETTLGNEENVFVTKTQPNQPESAALSPLSEIIPGNSASPSQAYRTVITANVNDSAPRISSLTCRLEILSEDVKAALTKGCKIGTVQTSPYTFIETVGPNSLPMTLEFPAPVLKLKSRTRIARKSSYIEVEAPLADQTSWKSFPMFIYPTFLELGTPTVWNMPYVNLECLPVVDTTKKEQLQWLFIHTSTMFTTKERETKAKSMLSDSENNVRFCFKESIFSMFMQYTGLQGRQTRLFGLNNPSDGGVHILVLISSLKLDIANRTVVLDAAILPLTEMILPKIRSFLAELTSLKVCSVKVDAGELQLWRTVLPAMVERSRTWEHRPNCEYLTKSSIPLSVENGQKLLCSCGNGQLPKDFITGLQQWDSVSKHFVRAAISPCFSTPFSEQLFDFDGLRKLSQQSPSGGCRGCGKDKSGNGGDLLKCGGCRKVQYCSSECQRADWKKHKPNCKSLQ